MKTMNAGFNVHDVYALLGREMGAAGTERRALKRDQEEAHERGLEEMHDAVQKRHKAAIARANAGMMKGGFAIGAALCGAIGGIVKGVADMIIDGIASIGAADDDREAGYADIRAEMERGLVDDARSLRDEEAKRSDRAQDFAAHLQQVGSERARLS